MLFSCTLTSVFFCYGFLLRGSGYLESAVGALESCRAGSSSQAPRALAENTVMLDEMTLRHMVQDCTAVKTQLLKLKRLLHQVSCPRGQSTEMNWGLSLDGLTFCLALLGYWRSCIHWITGFQKVPLSFIAPFLPCQHFSDYRTC